jgi:voltage-gated potassium channel
VLLALIIAGGTTGYTLIERWSPWDAFYMTMITVTTVGYREVHPLSRAGELFTVVIVTVGVATVLYSFCS